MKRYILVAITIMLMAATNAFADKESDKFLSEVAQANQGSMAFRSIKNQSYDVTATFRKKTFTLTTTINAIEGSDINAQTFYKIYSNYLKGNAKDIMLLDMLSRETKFHGFIENMKKSKATMKITGNIPGEYMPYEYILKPDEIRNINAADTVKIPELAVKLTIVRLPHWGYNFPIEIDDITLKRFGSKNHNLFMVCTDKSAKSIEQIEKDKKLYEMAIINAMKLFGLDGAVRLAANFNHTLTLRIHKDEREFFNIPIDNTSELFAKENVADTIDMYCSMAAIGMRKNLPDNSGKNITRTEIDYSNKTLTLISEVKDNSIKEELYNFYKADKAKLFGATQIIPDKETEKLGNIFYQINYKYVYTNPEWDKDICVEFNKNEFEQIQKDEHYQDSLLLAYITERFNFTSKYETDIREVHYFDGKIYTTCLLCKNKQISTDKVLSFLNNRILPNIRKNKFLTEKLTRWGIDIRLLAKNEITGKQSEVIIPYSFLRE